MNVIASMTKALVFYKSSLWMEIKVIDCDLGYSVNDSVENQVTILKLLTAPMYFISDYSENLEGTLLMLYSKNAGKI